MSSLSEGGVLLGQHRAIVSASRSRLFAPLLQFEKREIHTVFLRFPNFELSQKSRLGLLAKLCGVALDNDQRFTDLALYSLNDLYLHIKNGAFTISFQNRIFDKKSNPNHYILTLYLHFFPIL